MRTILMFSPDRRELEWWQREWFGLNRSAVGNHNNRSNVTTMNNGDTLLWRSRVDDLRGLEIDMVMVYELRRATAEDHAMAYEILKTRVR